LRLKIPPFRPHYGRPWSLKEIKLLGTARDKEVARRLGRTIQSVRMQRRKLRIAAVPWGRAWTHDELKLLGKLPDSVVAAKTGRVLTSVWAERQKRGIPPLRPVPKSKPWTWTEDNLLGKTSDQLL